MRCSRCGICCHQTRMMLSNADTTHLEKAGYDRLKFARLDKHGFLILRNRKGHCFFHDPEKHSCKIYRMRPAGCRIYPVMHSEQEGVVIDDLCPEKSTINESERERRGRKVIMLLRRIDEETLNRRSQNQAKQRSVNAPR